MCLANLINEDRLAEIYGNDPQVISYQKERYENVMQNYANKFVYSSDLHIFSASGRSLAYPSGSLKNAPERKLRGRRVLAESRDYLVAAT